MQFKELDYNKIIEDKKAFHEFIYTPLSEAIKILEERRKDKDLQKKIEELLDGEIPEIFKGDDLKGFQFRQIATPNHETLMFIKIAKDFDIKPFFCEHYEDKFTTNNKFKLSLGQIKINSGLDHTNGNYLFEKINIFDLKNNDGVKLIEIKTHWGEPLVDFHKNLFNNYNLCSDINFSNLSDWYIKNGNNPFDCYFKIFLLFISHGIMFENFLANKDEKSFTSGVILPNLKEVIRITGLKPLIVPIPPMDAENSEHVLFHFSKIKENIIN